MSERMHEVAPGKTVRMVRAPEEGFEGFVGWTFEVVETTQRRIRLRSYHGGRRVDVALFPLDITCLEGVRDGDGS